MLEALKLLISHILLSERTDPLSNPVCIYIFQTFSSPTCIRYTTGLSNSRYCVCEEGMNMCLCVCRSEVFVKYVDSWKLENKQLEWLGHQFLKALGGYLSQNGRCKGIRLDERHRLSWRQLGLVMA